MELKNLAKFYINEHGLITKTEDTSFIVSGSDNETSIELFIEVTPTTPTDIVVYASFKRADGFVISNRNMNLLGATEDGKYYDFLYTFTKDRILDIAGQLEVSFTIKSGNKTINSVSNSLYVRRNVKPNLETTSEEEFYQTALDVVEQAQQDINAHKLDFNNPHRVRGDQTKLNADSEETVDEKIAELEKDIDDLEKNKVNKTEVSEEATPNTIVRRDSGGRIKISRPLDASDASTKQYTDIAIDVAKNSTLGSANSYTDGKVSEGVEEAKTHTNAEVLKSVGESKNYTEQRFLDLLTNINTLKVDAVNEANANTKKLIDELVGLAPEKLDTLEELANAYLGLPIHVVGSLEYYPNGLTEEAYARYVSDTTLNLFREGINLVYSEKYHWEILIYNERLGYRGYNCRYLSDGTSLKWNHDTNTWEPVIVKSEGTEGDTTFIDVEELPIPTPVPTSGTFEKVYFNTELPQSYVNDLLDTLTYANVPQVADYPLIPVFSNLSMTRGMLVARVEVNEEITMYEVVLLTDGNTIDIYRGMKVKGETRVHDLDISLGWQVDKGAFFPFGEFGEENTVGLLAEQLGVQLFNEKLASLFSTTPFTQEINKIYRVPVYYQDDNKNKELTEYKYYQYKDGEFIEFGVGGGGGTGGGSSIIQLDSISELQHTIAKNGDLSLTFSFTPSVGTKGTLQIYANGVLKKSTSISSGLSTIPVSSYLKVGTNELLFKVSDSIGNQGTLIYLVEVVELTLKSNFNDITAYSGDIEFRYTPSGSGAKNITFKIDGNQYGTIDLVQSSGVQQSKIISGLTHGVHKLEVVAEALINGSFVSSNKLEYNIIYYVEGNDTILISSKFNTKTANQGELLSIDYVIYNPTSSTSTVNLLVNGSAVQQDLTQENERKYFFNNTDYPYGNVTFTIDVNGTTKSFVVDIAKAEINVEPITDNLQLYLTAKNRSNNESEASRNHWVFNDIDTELIDFNWSTNGWLNNTLRFNGKAKATIPFQMFKENFLTNGKTIEFEFATTDVYDLTKVLISCMSGGIGFEITPNTCTLKSTNTTLTTQFKEDEKVRISFVVQKSGELNLVKCLINGVVSGVVEYPNNDIWLQTNPVGISINHNEGSIDIYSIRVYNADLSSEQVLNNYIADMDLADKIQAYTRNNIIDTITQEVSYAKIKSLIPVMTIVGELPITKLGDDVDKPIVRVTFEDPINSNNNFEYEGVEINVQGTSSVDFPRKNYKLKFPTKFSFYEGAVPEKTYTMKADYMESSHSHNTGNAIIMNNISPTFPTQDENNGVRNAIYGFPIVIFNRPSEDSGELIYYGVFNFNNDKGNSDTIGLTTPSAESWEFKNNISDRCNFKTGDFSSGVSDDFEARYPKDSTNYINLQRVVSWVASTKNDINKFKNEFSQYFDKEFCLFYYVMMDVLLAVDSRSKNMFLDTLDGNIWYPRWYDMDTAYGLDNEGNLAFGYNLEQTDSIDGISVFNGSDSVLWNNFGEAFADDIATYYFNLRSSKKLSYDSLMEILYGHQISKISETMYNTDGQFKYIDIMDPSKVDVVDKSRLYAEQGSRLNHLQWWLNNRFSYLDSKYRYTDYVDDVITMRSYSADNYVVEPSGEFKITPYTSMYLSVTYGRNTTPVVVRGTNNVESSISPSSSVDLKNTETAIYGASKLLKLDGIPSKYARTMDFHNATRLKELVVGSGVSGYVNNNLTSLTVGNLTRLEKLDVQNCPKLEDTLDLSGCLNIKEVYAKGSGIKGVNLADGGNLQTIELPATVTSLSFVNQPFLSLNNIKVEGYSNIKQLRIEQCPLINEKTLLQRVINNVEFIRLTDINWQLVTDEQALLDTLMTKHGLNNKNEIDTGFPYLSGNIHLIGDVANSKLKRWKTAFPYITFTADNIIYVFYDVIWQNYLGNTIYSVTVEPGDSVTFPDSEPTRPDDAQYKDYIFTGWLGNDGKTYGNTITNISSNLILTPQFIGTIQKYNVYWYNGDELLEVDEVEYGVTAEYNGATPSGDGVFKGWSKSQNGGLTEDFTIFGDTTFYAQILTGNKLYITASDTSSVPSFYLSHPTTACDVTVDWGDGTSEKFSVMANNDPTGSATEIKKSTPYSQVGNYIITIEPIEKLKFGRYMNSTIPSNWYTKVDLSNIALNTAAFAGCTNLKEVVLKGNVSVVENADGIFDGCSSLTSVVIPDSVTTIGSNMFQSCSSLTSVVIPDSVTTIGSNSFNNCKSLTEIVIPDSVTSIQHQAFGYCNNLKSITMGSNVTNISFDVFKNCIALERIDFSKHTIVPTLADNVNSFTGVPSTCQIIIPDSLYDQWITATNWNTLYTNAKLTFVKASEVTE